jgi:hypothetical protein
MATSGSSPSSSLSGALLMAAAMLMPERAALSAASLGAAAAGRGMRAPAGSVDAGVGSCRPPYPNANSPPLLGEDG